MLQALDYKLLHNKLMLSKLLKHSVNDISYQRANSSPNSCNIIFDRKFCKLWRWWLHPNPIHKWPVYVFLFASFLRLNTQYYTIRKWNHPYSFFPYSFMFVGAHTYFEIIFPILFWWRKYVYFNALLKLQETQKQGDKTW